ncbi:hypothetical protein Tco_0500117, partial [Tanacetum coccineum]
TSEGLQFLGGKLVSWSSKKQDCTTMSTAEAEYVSLSACFRHSKTKHIDIRYHFIKEHVEKGTVEIYFVGTEYQLADLFTKALPKERFEYLVHRIGMRCMTPTQLESLKSQEEQEARENVELVKEHLASVEIEKMVEGSENVIDDSLLLSNDESKIPDTRLEPRSDKESPKVEITNDEEVEITNVVIPVNVNEEEEEITDEVSPRIHTDLVYSDTKKLQELTVKNTKTTPSSRSPSTNLSKTNRLLSLFKYSDTDHAGCKDDCKSTSGGLQFLGGKLVSWSSKKQDCTAMSTAEAEYVSLSACCAQVIWMRTQLLDYGYKYNRIPMYCDSKSAIAISCNPVQHSKTKHIDIRYHFIKEHVEKGTVEIYFVGTEYQLADLFTKAPQKERFEYLVHRIVIIMAQQQHAVEVHPDELCPLNKRFDLMDANKKVDLEHVQCPPESKILTNIIKNHPLRFSIAASSSVPWIYMAQFCHTLKEDSSMYRLKFMLDKKELSLTLDDVRIIFHLPQANDNNHNSSVPPPSFSDMVLFYKHELGFTMELKTSSSFKTTGLLQPWQTLCKIFLKCLTTRVTRWDQPPLQIMHMMYCFINKIHVDYAELLWEGLYYSLHYPTSLIPYPRFTKIIVSHYMTIFPEI